MREGMFSRVGACSKPEGMCQGMLFLEEHARGHVLSGGGMQKGMW